MTTTVLQRRPLLPREHGAYGQLLFPLAAVLSVGLPRRAAVFLAVAAMLAFFAHEPLVVALGRRGAREHRERGREAIGTFAALCALSLAAFVAFVAEGTHAALVLFAVPFAFLVGVACFVGHDAEKTTAGELLVSCALSTLALPLSVANGLPRAFGLGAALTFGLGHAFATLAVRAMIAAKREGGVTPGAWVVRIGGPLVALAGLLGCPSTLGAASLVTMLAPSVAIAWRLPAPRELRRVGYTLIGFSCLATAMLIAEGAAYAR